MHAFFSPSVPSVIVLGTLCTLLLARLAVALRAPVRAANRLRFDTPPPAEKSAPPAPTFRLGRLTLDE